MRREIRRKVKMVRAVRVEVVKQTVLARLLGTKGNPPGAKRKRIAMMRVMEGVKRKPVSRNSRKLLTPCALMGVHPCTPLTASLNNGCVKSMSWS